jgi:hypothetical protein
MAAKQAGVPVQYIQGIASPNMAINPQAFYAGTRRMRFPVTGLTSFAGLGSSDPVEVRKCGILSALIVRVKGTVAVATADPTAWMYDFPYGLVKEFRLSANGQSNLIQARGITIRTHELTTNPKLSDRGVQRYFAGTQYQQGTMSLDTDVWGAASGDPNPGAASGAHAPTTYSVDISYVIPVAADPKYLVGAIFAQSQATNVNLEIAWNTEAALVTKGSAGLTWDIKYSIDAVAYSIPQANGQFFVPDVTKFHQLTEFRKSLGTSGENQLMLPGTGPGRVLLRAYVQGNRTSTLAGNPFAVNDTNYSAVSWGFGGSDTPEKWASGSDLAQQNERETGCSLGKLWGMMVLDWASENALRDVIDTSTTSDLRINLSLASAPTGGYAQVAQELICDTSAGA